MTARVAVKTTAPTTRTPSPSPRIAPSVSPPSSVRIAGRPAQQTIVAATAPIPSFTVRVPISAFAVDPVACRDVIGVVGEQPTRQFDDLAHPIIRDPIMDRAVGSSGRDEPAPAKTREVV